MKTEIVENTFFETRFGKIPSYWSFPRLNEICKINQGLQIPISKRLKVQKNHEKVYITIQYYNGKSEPEYIENPSPSVCCKKDDILMTRTGNTGIVISNVEGVFHNNFFKINYNRERIDKNYFLFFLRLQRTKHQILTLAGSSTIPDINHKDFYSIQIPLPSLPEQKKITEILSTWDQAIEKLEKLIELKEQRKKGLMQQLLTGKKRLPGFGISIVRDGDIPEGWEEHSLYKISDVMFSNVDKKTYAGQKEVYLCNYTDVYKNDYITDKIKFMQSTASEVEISKFGLCKDDVIITKDSETPDDIGIPTVVLEDLDNVVCGYHLALIRPKTEIVDGIFLSKKFNEQHVRYLFSTLANGATRFGLSTSSIKHLKITIPRLSEQVAIREVLFSQDEEIRIIKQKITYISEQKKGLMQKLLTGEIRVKL